MQTITPSSLFRARLYLEEGRSHDALTILETVQPQMEETEYDVAYLKGWCFIQLYRWDDARNVLAPLLQSARNEDPDQEPLLDRERLILYLLRLGQVAVTLAHYDDARIHFGYCLKLLRDRRVNLPLIRIRARFFLAMTYLMKGICSVAIQHYEEALRLAEHYKDEESLPDIYYGLCDANRGLGNFIEAYEVGRKALHLYQEQGKEILQARVYNLLGFIVAQMTDTEEAEDYYMQSLRLAEERQNSVMIMLNYAGLTELRLQQGRFEEVTSYSNKALSYAQQVNDKNMAGSVYISIAKVILIMAESAEEVQREAAYARAVELFQEAEKCLKDTQSYVELAELYGRWAEVLEHSGQAHEAFRCWKSACLMMKKTKAAECQPQPA